MCPQPLRDASPPQCSFIPGYTQFSTYPGYTFIPWCTKGWNSGFFRVHVYYSMAFYLMVDSSHVTSAAVFPPFFAQSERSLCVIYSIKFNKQFQPFAILCQRQIINSKAAFYIGLLCPFVKSNANECVAHEIGISAKIC